MVGCVTSLICPALQLSLFPSRVTEGACATVKSTWHLVPCYQHMSLCKDLLWLTLFIRDGAAIASQWNPRHLYATDLFFKPLKLPVAIDGKWPACIQTCPQHHRHVRVIYFLKMGTRQVVNKIRVCSAVGIMLHVSGVSALTLFFVYLEMICPMFTLMRSTLSKMCDPLNPLFRHLPLIWLHSRVLSPRF